jgi:hypothetical protein
VVDKVAEVLPQQDLAGDATVAKLSGKGGVFVGGDDDIAAAKVRYEAMQAVEDGRATPDQLQLLRDLDRVLQGARTEASQQGAPVPPPVPPVPPPPSRPRVVPGPVPAGTPRPPRHSRNR